MTSEKKLTKEHWIAEAKTLLKTIHNHDNTRLFDSGDWNDETKLNHFSHYAHALLMALEDIEKKPQIADGYVTVNDKGELNEYWQDWEIDGKRARMIEVFKDADMAEWDKPLKGWRIRPVKLVFLDEEEADGE